MFFKWSSWKLIFYQFHLPISLPSSNFCRLLWAGHLTGFLPPKWIFSTFQMIWTKGKRCINVANRFYSMKVHWQLTTYIREKIWTFKNYFDQNALQSPASILESAQIFFRYSWWFWTKKTRLIFLWISVVSNPHCKLYLRDGLTLQGSSGSWAQYA